MIVVLGTIFRDFFYHDFWQMMWSSIYVGNGTVRPKGLGAGGPEFHIS